MTIAHQIKINWIALAEAAAMSGGFLLLLGEIRFEHREVLVDDWRPWIPMFFCVLMALLIPLSTMSNRPFVRKLRIFAYASAMLLGILGTTFHAGAHPLERIRDLLYVWTTSVQSGAAVAAHHPPILAPLSFVGLGSIGLLMIAMENAARKKCEDERG